MVDVVGDVGGKAPVVGDVPEEVDEGHGGVGEAVEEQRLQEALAVVQAPADACQTEGNCTKGNSTIHLFCLDFFCTNLTTVL